MSVSESSFQPAPEPEVGPAVKPEIEPAIEHATEPATEPAIKSGFEPGSGLAPEPAPDPALTPSLPGAWAGDAVVDVRGVSTVLGGITIHRDLSLQVQAGEVLALIGGSGSGKTTLLRLMLGLLVPQTGEIRVLGHPLGRCEVHDLERVRHRWGVLFQQGALFSALSVFDNVALPLRELKAVPRKLLEPLVMLKLAQVGLQPGDAAKMPAELSGGMVKRVSLARALILDPLLLFLDEPTAGLDPDSAKQFVQLVRQLRHELGLTVVMVTHDVDTLFALADRVAVLADQRLVAVGPLQQVAGLKQPFVAKFFMGHASHFADEHSLQSYRHSLGQMSVAAQPSP